MTEFDFDIRKNEFGSNMSHFRRATKSDMFRFEALFGTDDGSDRKNV